MIQAECCGICRQRELTGHRVLVGANAGRAGVRDTKGQRPVGVSDDGNLARAETFRLDVGGIEQQPVRGVVRVQVLRFDVRPAPEGIKGERFVHRSISRWCGSVVERFSCDLMVSMIYPLPNEPRQVPVGDAVDNIPALPARADQSREPQFGEVLAY